MFVCLIIICVTSLLYLCFSVAVAIDSPNDRTYLLLSIVGFLTIFISSIIIRVTQKDYEKEIMIHTLRGDIPYDTVAVDNNGKVYDIKLK